MARKYNQSSFLTFKTFFFVNSSVYLDKVRYHNKNTVSDTLLASGKIGEVSTEDLYHHFSKFGKIITINRIRDRSGKFKRNARIIFQSTDEIDQVLKQKEHVVGGQIVDCQRSNRSSNE